MLALAAALRREGYLEEALALKRARRGGRAEAGAALSLTLRGILEIDGLDPDLRGRAEALSLIFEGL